ncbi:MAG TPA: ACP phosphodiesterase, partial [Rheinheimera sp.]|nr:ACP phosphodiesterase [Rheinheimera sp.]
MPLQMRDTMRRVRQQDWLASYQQLPAVGQALDNIAKRLRFANAFSGIIVEIMPRYHDLEQAFLNFYPQLQQHIAAIKLEAAY